MVERALAGGPKLSAGVIIPKKGVVELKRALDAVSGTCQIAVKTPYVFIGAHNLSLAIKLIDSQFPPYDKVVPKNNSNRVLVDRALFVDSLKRASLMSSDTRGIRVSISSGVIQISGDNPDIGEVKEELEATYEGETISVGFNPRYVLDLLGHITTPEIAIELAGDLDPVVIRPRDDQTYLGVVMPMRI
jgi:DNA polymerase-3 subunit beta